MKTVSLPRSFALATALALSAFGQPATPAEPATWHFDTGLHYSRGDYGFTDDTEVVIGLLTATVDTARWRLQALVPVVNISGPATVVGGAGQGGSAPGRPTTASETGLGDVTAGAAYKFGPVFGDTSLDLGAQVKLPTADEDKGLGTGKADTYVQADLRRTVGSYTPFTTVGYRFLGHSARYPLRDGFYASIGFVNTLTVSTSVGGSFTWRQRLVRGGDHSAEVLGFFLRSLGDRWRVQGYALAGFTDASPDFGAGLSLGCRF